MAYDDELEPPPTKAELQDFLTDAANAQQHPCRYCNAQPNQPCTNKETNQPIRFPHPQRITDHQNRNQLTFDEPEDEGLF